MSIERERLLSLIEFAQQSARLRSKPAATVAEYGLFALYEHQIHGLPGIHLNLTSAESEDEIWLVVERLHEMQPPEITSAQPLASTPTRPLTDDIPPLDRERTVVAVVRSRDVSRPSFDNYVAYGGPAENDPRTVSASVIAEGIVRIVDVEGPVVAKRVYDIYLRGSGIKRMGHELKSTMNRALTHAIRQGQVVSEDEAAKGGMLFSVVRVKGSSPIKLRSRGPRSFGEIPPSELKALAKYLVERHGFTFGSEAHLRAVLEHFDLKRLTTQVDTMLRQTLERHFPYVDEFLISMRK